MRTEVANTSESRVRGCHAPGSGSWAARLAAILLLLVLFAGSGGAALALTVANGDNNAAIPLTISGGARTDVVIHQIKLTATELAGVTIESFTFDEIGDANGLDDISAVRIVIDANDNAAIDGGESDLSITGQFKFNADAGSLTVTLTNGPGGQFEIDNGGANAVHVLVVIDTTSTFRPTDAPGDSLQLRLTNVGAKERGTGTDVSAAVNITSNIVSAIGTLTVIAGTSMPPAANIDCEVDNNDVPLLQLRFTAALETVNIRNITILEDSGSILGDSEMSDIKLIIDANGNGIFDGGETVAATAANFASDNGEALLDAENDTAVIPVAPGTLNLLITADISNAGFIGGETVKLALNTPNTKVVSAGLSSTEAISITSTTKISGNTMTGIGNVDAALGASNPAARNEVGGARTGLVLQQLAVTSGPDEGMKVASIKVTETGTAQYTDYANIYCVVDTNGNAVVDGAETKRAMSADPLAFSGEGGTATITFSTPVDVPAGTTVNLLLVANTNATFTGGETLSVRVAAPQADIAVTGALSLKAITTTSSAALNSNAVTGIGSISAVKGASSPSGGIRAGANVNAPILQVAFTAGAAENINLTGITIREQGTIDEVNDITSNGAGIAVDTNGNGILDAGETVITTQTFSSNTVTFNLAGTPISVAAGTTVNVLFLASTDSGYAFGQTIQYDITNPSIHIAAVGATSAQAVQATDPAIAGNPIEAAGAIALTKHASSPANSVVTEGAGTRKAILLLTYTATDEDVLVDSIKITEAGTCVGNTDISNVALVFDTNGDGVLDGGETALTGTGTATFGADNGTITLNPDNAVNATMTVSPGTPKSFFVICDTTATFDGGDTIVFTVASPRTDYAATGQTSGEALRDDSTTAITSGTMKAKGTLVVANGDNPPSTIVDFGVNTQVPFCQVKLTAGDEDVTVTSLVLTESGTAHGANDYRNIGLVIDSDGDGTVSGVEAVAAGTGTGTFSADSGTITLTPTTPITITKATSVNLLFLCDTTSTYAVIAGGETLKAVIATPVSQITASGVSSGEAITDSSALTNVGDGTVRARGTISMVLGGSTPAAGGIPYEGNTNVPVMQISVGAKGENVTVDNIAVTEIGTAAGGTELTAVNVAVDTNGNGLLDGVEAALALSAANTFASDGDTVVLDLVTPLTVTSGTTTELLILFTTDASMAVGKTLQARIGNPSTDYLATGVTSTLALTDSSATAIDGNAITTTGKAALTIGGSTPAAGGTTGGARSDIAVAQFTLTALGENITLESVTLTEAGAAHGTDDITAVGIAVDTNGNGILDGAETKLALTGGTVFSADGGTVTLTLTTPEQVLLGTPKNFLILFTTDGSFLVTENDTLKVSVANPRTDYVAKGAGSLRVYDTSTVAIDGNELTAVGTIAASLGTSTPPAKEIAEGANTRVAVLQLKFTAGLENCTIPSVMISHTGSCDASTDLTNVGLIIDADSDGVADPGELPLTGTGTGVNVFALPNGTITLTPDTPVPVTTAAAVNLLVVCDTVAGQFAGGETIIFAMVDPSNSYVATGATSAMTYRDTQTGTLTSSTITAIGSISVALGPNNPAEGGVGAGQFTNVPIMQLRFTAGGEAVNVTSLTLKETGSADGVTDISAVALVIDLDGDGVVSAGEARLPGTGTGTFLTDNGTITLAPTDPINVPASGTLDLLVVFDTTSTFVIGDALRCEVSNPSANYLAMGVTSGKNIYDPSTNPIVSNNLYGAGSIALTLGGSTPAAGNIPAGAVTRTVVVQLAIAAGSQESANVTSIKITEAGTAHGANDLRNIGLVLDSDNDGVMDATESVMSGTGTATFSADNGSLTLTPSAPVNIPAGATRNLLVVCDTLAGFTAGETIVFSVANPRTDYAATGLTSGQVLRDGSATAVTGNELRGTGTVSAVLGANSPLAGTIIAGAAVNSMVVMQVKLQSSSAEPMTVNSIIFTEAGTVDGLNEITRVDIVVDDGSGNATYAGDGIVNNGEAAEARGGDPTFAANDGTLTITPTTPIDVPAGNSVNILVVCSLSSSVTAGKTVKIKIANPHNDMVAQGVNSGQTVSPVSTDEIASATFTYSGSITAAIGNASPAAGGIPAGANNNVVALQLKLTAGSGEDISVTRVIVTEAGTANGASDITTVSLVVDTNGNGIIDAGETELAGTGTATFAGDNSTVTLVPTSPIQITKGTAKQILVVVDTSPTFSAGASPADAILVKINNPSTDILGIGAVSAKEIKDTGTASIAGNALTATGDIAMILGPGTPAAGGVTYGVNTNLPVMQLRFTAGSTEGVRIESVNITEAGSAIGNADIKGIGIFVDNGAGGGTAGNGIKDGTEQVVVDPADPLNAFGGDNGTITLTPITPVQINAGASVDMVVIIDTNGSLDVNRTLIFKVGNPYSDYVATGVNSATRVRDPNTTAVTSATLVTMGILSAVLGAVPIDGPIAAGVHDNLVVMQLMLTAAGESINLTAITVSEIGTAAGSTDISNVGLVYDTNGDGLAGEGVRPGTGTATFSADGATIELKPISPITITSGSTASFLVTVDTPSTFQAGKTVRFKLGNPSADVASKGASSGATIKIGSSTALTAATLTAIGQVAASAGTANPAASGLPSVTDISRATLLQLSLATSGEDAVLHSVTIKDTGTADGSTDMANLALSVDLDNDGVFDTATETVLTGTGSATFSADNGTYSLTPATPLTLTAGSTVNLLVLTNTVGAGFDVGETMSVSIDDPAADIVIKGALSGQTIEASGAAIAGNAKTGTGDIAMTIGGSTPAAAFIGDGALTDVAVLQFSLTAKGEEMDLVGIKVTEAGKADGVNDIQAVSVWLDANGDGTVDGGDTELTLSSGGGFSADNGTAALVFTPGQGALRVTDIDNGGSIANFIVAIDTKSTFSGGDTLKVTITDPSASYSVLGATSALTILDLTTTAITSNELTGNGTIGVALGAANPAAGFIPGGARTNLAAMQLAFTAGSEAVAISSMTFTEIGTADAATDYAGIGVAIDLDGDGVLDTGETELSLASGGTFSGGATTLTFTSALTVEAGATTNLIVTADTTDSFINSTGDAIQLRMADPQNAGYAAKGVKSGATLKDASAVDIDGNALTAKGNMTIALGDNAPASARILAGSGSTGKVAAQIKFTVGGEDALIDSLKFTKTGTAADSDATAVYLIPDNGAGGGTAGNGAVDGTEAASVLGTGTFSSGVIIFGTGGTAFTGNAADRTALVGTPLNLLLVLDIANTFSAGETMTVSVANPSADMTATGSSSGQPVSDISTSAIAGATFTAAGSLAVAAGASLPAGASIAEGIRTNLAVHQVKFTAAGENVKINSIKITETGTADGSAHVTEVSLAVDSDADGILDAGETELTVSKGSTFATDNGTVTIDMSSSPVTVTAGTSTNLLILFDTSATFAGGLTLSCSIANPSTDVSGSGVTSLVAITDSANTTAIGSNTFLAKGTLAAAAGSAMPSAGPVSAGANSNLVAVQLSVTAGFGEDIDLVSVKVTEAGSANPVTDMSEVSLAIDADGDGILDLGETELAGTTGATFAGDGGSITLTPGTPVRVAKGTTVRFLVLVDTTTGFAVGETLRVGISAPSTDLAATGVSSAQAVDVTGSAIDGPILTAAGTISAAYGGFPGSGTVLPKGVNSRVTLMSLTFTATGEDIAVSSIKLSESGTVDASIDLLSIGLVVDSDGSGGMNGAETFLPGTGSAAFSGADGTVTLTATQPAVVVAGSSATILVVGDTGATFSNGKTILLTMGNPSTDYTASGATTLLSLKDASTTAIAGNSIRAVVPADSAVAEVSPILINADGVSMNDFTYAFKPTITANNSGVDTFRITVPAEYTSVEVFEVRKANTILTLGVDYTATVSTNVISVVVSPKLGVAQSGQEVVVKFKAKAPTQAFVGQKTFAGVVDDSTKSSPVAASAGDAGNSVGTSSITVTAGGIDRFSITASTSSPVSGKTTVLSLKAVDVNGGTVSFYDGNVRITASGASQPARIKYTGTSVTDNGDGTADIANTGTEWSQGIALVTVLYDMSGEKVTFTATEKDTGLSKSGTSGEIVWQSESATATIAAGSSESVTLALTDGTKAVIPAASYHESLEVKLTRNFVTQDKWTDGTAVPDPEELNVNVTSVRSDAGATSNLVSYTLDPPGTIFVQPIEFLVPIPAHIPAAYYSRLRLYWWDGYEWMGVGGTQVTVGGKPFLKAMIQHFSLFRLVLLNSLPAESGSRVIQSVKFVNNPFSPNGDGINDGLIVRVTFGRSATATLKIYDSSGDLIHTIVKDNDVPSGESSWEWKGATRWGDPVEPGVYVLRVEASTASGGADETAMIGVVY